MTETNLEYVSNIQDLVDLYEYLDDERLAEAMDLAVKCIVKPDVPPAVARKALVMMQGFAFQFRMQAVVYTYIHKGKTGSVENVKKNAYFAISDQCHELAQTLKYIAKEAF